MKFRDASAIVRRERDGNLSLLHATSALTVSGDDPGTLEFVCLDQRLTDAARKEGLDVLVA